jgi:hypothetical protein
MANLGMEQSKALKDYELRMNEINSKNTGDAQKMEIEREKIKLGRENMANDLAVAKENAKGRNNKKG